MKKGSLGCLFLVASMASTGWSEEEPPSQADVARQVLEKRQAQRARRGAVRAYRGAVEAEARREAAARAERLAPVLAAREAAARRDAIEAQRVRIEAIRAAAEIRQAQALERAANQLYWSRWSGVYRRPW